MNFFIVSKSPAVRDFFQANIQVLDMKDDLYNEEKIKALEELPASRPASSFFLILKDNPKSMRQRDRHHSFKGFNVSTMYPTLNFFPKASTWEEEVKMAHKRFIQEKVNKYLNIRGVKILGQDRERIHITNDSLIETPRSMVLRNQLAHRHWIPFTATSPIGRLEWMAPKDYWTGITGMTTAKDILNVNPPSKSVPRAA